MHSILIVTSFSDESMSDKLVLSLHIVLLLVIQYPRRGLPLCARKRSTQIERLIYTQVIRGSMEEGDKIVFIKVRLETRERLKEIGWKGQSYEDVIITMLKELKIEHSGALREPTINDKFPTITVSKEILAMLQSIEPHGRTMNSVIQELYEAYLYKRHSEVGQPHD